MRYTRTQFILATGIAFLLASAIIVGFVHSYERQRAIEEAEAKAMIILNRNLATHAYFNQELKPKLFNLTESIRNPDYFDPQWMSSTYAIREIDKMYQSLSKGGYYYKECAINARSPSNEADDFEKVFLKKLNADPKLEKDSGVRMIGGKAFFYLLRRGEKMESVCMRCHSEPSRAPGNMVVKYGPERSFHRDVGAVVSAISIRIPLEAAYANVNTLTLKLSGLMMGILFIIVSLQFQFINRLIFAPLALLRNKVWRIVEDKEHLGEEIKVPLGRELSELAEAFNKMSLNLRENMDELETRVKQRTAQLASLNKQLIDDINERKEFEEKIVKLQALLNDTGRMAKVGGWELDAQTLEVSWTEETYRIHEVPFDSKPSLEEAINFFHPEDREKLTQAINRALEYGEPYDLEIRFITAKGKHLWTHTKSSPQIVKGKVTKIVGTFQDITQRKQAEEDIKQLNEILEQRVAERTAQLESSNKELEEFAYSIAHTMRAPLRALDGFSRIIQEEYADRLDAEGNRLLNVIRSNAHEINQLIADLLTLSQARQAAMKFSRIDMTALISSVYHELAPPDTWEKFAFSVSPLPDAVGDPTLIRQVWANLISNAIKYTLPKEERRIEIGGRGESGQNIYFIRDTGVGFNPDYMHKLFGIFQRLHKVEEFEGTGVGLAIVQRIIHRHGGKVWAEGKVNGGATFWFSMPTKQGNSE